MRLLCSKICQLFCFAVLLNLTSYSSHTTHYSHKTSKNSSLDMYHYSAFMLNVRAVQLFQKLCWLKHLTPRGRLPFVFLKLPWMFFQLSTSPLKATISCQSILHNTTLCHASVIKKYGTIVQVPQVHGHTFEKCDLRVHLPNELFITLWLQWTISMKLLCSVASFFVTR